MKTDHGSAALLRDHASASAEFHGRYVGISFIFRRLWTVVFVGEAHELGHAVREAIA
jgi:hypothetical protein